MAQLLQVSGLEAGYGPVRVLHDVSLHVDEGEIVAVLGPNGAGKSTLMNTLVGAVGASSGSIEFKSSPIAGLRVEQIVRLGLTLVPEGRQTFGTLSVIDNLRMGAYSRKDRGAVSRRIDELFERFPRLGERRDQLAGTLSGGEQQQLVICRALLAEPSMILLDEPSLGLAPVMMDTVFELVTELRARDGLTVLLVEQSVTRALAAADRAYVLSGGRIVADGTAEEMRSAADKIEESYLGGAS